MEPLSSRRFDHTPNRPPKVPDARTILAPVLACLTLGGYAGLARSQELSLDPNPATVDRPVVVTVTGFANCPQLFEPVRGHGFVDIEFSGDCGSGTTVRYRNPSGRRFETITDTTAFATCP